MRRHRYSDDLQHQRDVAPCASPRLYPDSSDRLNGSQVRKAYRSRAPREQHRNVARCSAVPESLRRWWRLRCSRIGSVWLVCWLNAFRMAARQRVRRAEPEVVPATSLMAFHECLESTRPAETPAMPSAKRPVGAAGFVVSTRAGPCRLTWSPPVCDAESA